jgi:Mrp family chromosome partitioning ATPase
MARMLQALKNLEARSPRPAAEPASKSAGTPPEGKTEGGRGGEIERRSDDQRPSSSASVTPAINPLPSVEGATGLVRPARRSDAPPLMVPAAKTEIAKVEPIAAAASPSPLQLLAAGRTEIVAGSPGDQNPFLSPLPKSEETVKRAAPTATRPPTSFERLVARTLSDPSTGRPLRELVDRLRRDLEQTGSRTVAVVGVGEPSGARDAIAYAARLLAEKLPGPVLVVDADLARRPLTAAFEYGEEPGLAELVSAEQRTNKPYQLTAIANVSFLPAGRLPQADLSTVRGEQLLQQLGEEFACVLIDGGRTSDTAAFSLARVADATYFIVKLGAVETNEAQAALRDFRAAGARVLGAIAT